MTAQQIAEFSEDPTTFGQQIQTFFERSQKKNVKNAAAQFQQNLIAGAFSDQQIQQTAEMFNLMQKNKVQKYPAFSNYIDVLNTISVDETGGGTADYDNWFAFMQKSMEAVKKFKAKPFTDVLRFSRDFFMEGAIHAGQATNWLVENGKHRFYFEEKTALLEIKEVDLIARSRKDSLKISQTSGVVDIRKDTWKGKKGDVAWSREEVNEPAHVQLRDYEINLDKGEYKADSVLFSHDEFFTKAILGAFKDRLSGGLKGRYDYPAFDSYSRKIQQKNIFPQVEFRGGFGMRGNKMIFAGEGADRASVIFRSKDGKKIVRATSLFMGIKDRAEINAVDTEMSAYFGNDSIYHPYLNLNFKVAEGQFRASRNDKATSQIAFMSSFHKVDIDMDAMQWNINDTIILFKKNTLLKNKPVLVSSFDYYEPRMASKYRRAINTDPIAILGNWTESTLSNVMPATDFARSINGSFKVEQVTSIIYDLIADGFVYYYPEEGNIYIRDKARHFNQARMEQTDFDRIRLKSVINKENLTLDINSSILSVVGVKHVSFADSQRVVLFPYDQVIEIDENRNMSGSGDLVAGKIDFVDGENFFNYDDFSVRIDTVDKMILYVMEETSRDGVAQLKEKKIRTPIRDAVGIISIDNPGNKSGLVDNPNYPKFEATGHSYLYYDSKDLYNGAYERDRFYFKLDPFSLQKIDQIQKDDILLRGFMSYAGIFPSFQTQVAIQDDYSLGVIDEVSGDNAPLYTNIGSFKGSVFLNEKGLHGSGFVNFLSGKFYSSDFVFLPDSMMVANMDSFRIKRSTRGDISNPEVRGLNTKSVRWFPYNDSMVLNTDKGRFKLFEDRADFKGEMIFGDRGLIAKGAFIWKNSIIRSNRFDFDEETVEADTINIEIKTNDDKYTALRAKHLTATIDVYEEEARIRPFGEFIPVEFPYSDIIGQVDRIDWDYNDKDLSFSATDNELNCHFRVMTEADKKKTLADEHKKTLEMAEARKQKRKKNKDKNKGEVADTSVVLIDSLGVATTAKVDSLSEEAAAGALGFEQVDDDPKKKKRKKKKEDEKKKELTLNWKGTGGEMDLEKKLLITKGVEGIRIADALIVPGDGEIIVSKDGRFEVLKDATIFVDTVTQYHKIVNAEVRVLGLQNFTGSGEYVYQQENLDDQIIKFNRIETGEPDLNEKEKKKRKKEKAKDALPDFYTFSSGKIDKEDEFRLNEQLSFKGQVLLESQKKFLTFDGYSKVTVNSPSIHPEWFAFTQEIDPQKIRIELENPVNDLLDTLQVGVLFSFNDFTPYTSFLQRPETKKDFPIISTDGLLEFDNKNRIFRLGEEERLKGLSSRGNVVAILDEKDMVVADGKMRLGRDFGLLTVDAAGRLEGDMGLGNYKIDKMIMGLDFDFDGKALGIITNHFKNLLLENDEIEYVNESFVRNIVQLIDEKDEQLVVDGINQSGFFEKPKKNFDYELFLTDIDLVWDTLDASFKSKGKFGLGYIGDSYVNRMTDGFIEFAPREKSDFFTVYMEVEDWETNKLEWYFFHYNKGILEVLSSNGEFNSRLGSLKESKRSQDKKGVTYKYRLANSITKNDFIIRMTEQ